jgi:hypothetical protein
MNNKAEFDIGRRHGLLLDICADRDLDRTGIHLAAVLLLHHCNSRTGQCNPNQELIAHEMGRTERTVRYGIASLEARWMRQIRHPRRNTCYEWNWDRVSTEEWKSRAEAVLPLRAEALLPLRAEAVLPPRVEDYPSSPYNRESNREENKEENTHGGVCVRPPPGDKNGKEAKPVADGNLLSDRSLAHSGGDRALADGITDDHGRPGNGANPGDDDNLDHAVAEYLRAYPMTGGDVEAVRREMAKALATAPLADVLDGLSYHEAQVWAGKEDRYIPRPENFLRRRMWAIRRSGPAPTIDNDGRLVPTNGHGAVPSGIRPDVIAGAERALARHAGKGRPH